MDFIPNGSEVSVKGTTIKGTITGVCARGDNNSFVEYEIVYWVNGERRTQWLLPLEIELAPKTKQAGFVTYPEKNLPKLDKP